MLLDNTRIKKDDWRKHAQQIFEDLITIKFANGGITEMRGHLLADEGLIHLHFFLHLRPWKSSFHSTPRCRARLEISNSYECGYETLGEFDLDNSKAIRRKP